MEGFRVAGHISEFFSDLDQLKKQNNPMMVWQTVNGKKVIAEGSIQGRKKEKGEIIIEIKVPTNKSFVQDNSIYIYEEKQGILFKGEYQFCVAGLLKIVADEKVLLKEKRAENRFSFNYTAVKVKVIVGMGKELSSVKLKDVTSSGVGMIVTKTEKENFNAGDEFKLTHINGIQLPQQITATVRHISTYIRGRKKTTEFIVGAEFKRKSKLFKKVIEAVTGEEIK